LPFWSGLQQSKYRKSEELGSDATRIMEAFISPFLPEAEGDFIITTE